MLAVSYRPLNIDEVAEALSVDCDGETFNREESGFMNKYDILKVCSCLVTLSESASW
jgi:hypothetical protein